jgi:class 3 adenylate cyclase
MSEATAVTTTVMFADICRSVYLFSRLGDEKAAELIGRALEEAAAVVERCEGVVLRTKGDDVLCIFSDPLKALEAAMLVHAQLMNVSSHGAGELAMRIGINSGPALLSEGDILGDTVNTAARLSSFAKAGQSMVASQTIDLLERAPSGGLIRPVGSISLKGKPGPISVFELLDSRLEDEITQVGSVSRQFPKSNRLSISFQSHQDDLDYRLVRYLFGRLPDCDLVMDHPLVSRHHAEIRYQHDEFVLIDFSTNGTVLITNGQERKLHHSQAALRGSGSIFLGRTLYNSKFEIAFQAGGGSRAIS